MYNYFRKSGIYSQGKTLTFSPFPLSHNIKTISSLSRSLSITLWSP